MATAITLLTDYGTADGYTGALKGVLHSITPDATLHDITHEIAPGDIQAGAVALARAWQAWPEGTVHLAVVDPGVGTARRALAVLAGGHRFVAPDNGLLTPVLALRGAAAWAIPVPEDAAPTFHGRDVFAPAAARLAAGALPQDLGAPVSDPVRLPRPRLVRQGGSIVGQVVHVDRFGTLVTSIPGNRVAPGGTVRVGAYDLPLLRTFADAAPGDPLALIGSSDLVEVAVRDGRADTVLGVTLGAEVRATAAAEPRNSRAAGRPTKS